MGLCIFHVCEMLYYLMFCGVLGLDSEYRNIFYDPNYELVNSDFGSYDSFLDFFGNPCFKEKETLEDDLISHIKTILKFRLSTPSHPYPPTHLINASTLIQTCLEVMVINNEPFY